MRVSKGAGEVGGRVDLLVNAMSAPAEAPQTMTFPYPTHYEFAVDETCESSLTQNGSGTD